MRWSDANRCHHLPLIDPIRTSGGNRWGSETAQSDLKVDLLDRPTMTHTHRNKSPWWSRRLAALQPLLALMVLSLACSGGGDPIGKGMHGSGAAKEAELPDITSFLTRPSDRFLVDLDEITGGHPFKGADSPSPHAGAHVHFDNSNDRWSKGSDEPSNYPAIYAVADGTIGRLTTHFPLSGWERPLRVRLGVCQGSLGCHLLVQLFHRADGS